MRIKHLFTKLIAMGLVSAMIFTTDLSVLAQEATAPVAAVSEEITEAEVLEDAASDELLSEEVSPEEALPESEAVLPESGESEAVTDVVEESAYNEKTEIIVNGDTEEVYPEPIEEICNHEGEITEIVNQATLETDGSVTRICADCGELVEQIVLRKPVKFSLSKTTYEYSGSACKPLIGVYDDEGNLIDPKNYKVTYSKYVSIGNPTLTVKFDGRYYTGTKTVSYKIRPRMTEITYKTQSKTKNAITVKWRKVTTKTSGYQIEYSTSSSFSSPKKITITDNTVVSRTISSLSYGKTYYVRVRTYYQPKDTKYYSSWSEASKVTTYTKDKIAAVKVAQDFMNYAKSWDCANMNKLLRSGKTSAFPYPQSIVFNYLLSKNQSYFKATPTKCTSSSTTATITMKVSFRNYYAPSYMAYYDLVALSALTGQVYSDKVSYQKLKGYIIDEAKTSHKPFTDSVTMTVKATKKDGVWKVKSVPDGLIDIVLCGFISASDDWVNDNN